MLVVHGSHDMYESLIGRKESMSPREQIAFQPALAHVLAEDFHDAAFRSDVRIAGQDRCRGNPVGNFEYSRQAGLIRLIRPHAWEVAIFPVEPQQSATELSQRKR